MNWAREVISPAAGKMLLAASLDNNYKNYVDDANLTATGAVAYGTALHHDGYAATGAVKLVGAFTSFDLQDGFAVGCHFHALQAFSAAARDDFYDLLALWDGTNLANGYLLIRLEYRDGRENGLDIISFHGGSRGVRFEDMTIADAADHSVVVTGKYDTASDTGKILIYVDGHPVGGVLLTNANTIFDTAQAITIGNYTGSTGFPAECNISDVFVLKAFIEDPEVVQRYHGEGLNLDCVNDGKVFNPGYRVFGYDRKWTADDYGFEAMAYDPDTQRLWGAGATDATRDRLYYADEDGSSVTEAEHFEGSGDYIMSVVVIDESLFVCIRNATGVNKLYKSDKTTISFSAVLTLEPYFYAIAGWSGPIKTPSGDMYFSEYDGPTTGGNGANIYRSDDDGDTWASSKQLDAPGGTKRHFHAIFYDPYRKYIWASWGDGTSYFGVCYSDDDSDDSWTDLFTQATANVTDVFGSLQSIQGYATRRGCVWAHDCRAQNPANAFWWEANDEYIHGYDGCGAAMQQWSALGAFLSPNDPHIFAIHKAKNGTTWMMGNKEANESDYCIYLSHNDCRTMVLADNPAEIGPYVIGAFVETQNYIWQGAARFRNWAKVIPA